MVITTIALIFAYLFLIAAPLFLPASVEPLAPVSALSPDAGAVRLVDSNESGEVVFAARANGNLEFYAARDGSRIAAFTLDRPIASARRLSPTTDHYELRDADGGLWLARVRYPVSFAGDRRQIGTAIDFPFGAEPLFRVTNASFDLLRDDDRLILVALDQPGSLRVVERSVASGMRRERTVELTTSPTRVILGPRGRLCYLLDARGGLEIRELQDASTPVFIGSLRPTDAEISAIEPLLGRYSLVVADTRGQVTQWMLISESGASRMAPVRRFDVSDESAASTASANIVRIVAEPRRKGFATIRSDGAVSLVYPTSQRVVARANDLAPGSPTSATIAPRSDVLMIANAGSIARIRLDNPHPEISLSALWGRVWYESYSEPVYSWQSSAAETDFEPKFSLSPLLLGTIKAATYALVLAIPFALMAAIYTAVFMAPRMRAIVKPGIETMAALPTVVLGFIGGLWLAPVVEANLAGVVALVVVLPVGVFLGALAWSRLPASLTVRWDGWYGLLAIPLIIAIVTTALHLGPLVEAALLGGDARLWLSETLGLGFDQRNALVVGLIMGLAVMPTIFTIAEDALHSVPTGMVNGSLALGATKWQTLTRVILLTASPGIFSAITIGMGRAVGETMIVLMATGNTPLMNFNLFEGMRTFAANIAVEMPESEVGSTHFRLLFLTALVLFLITFALNTIAEVVRQRLRKRYAQP